MNRRSKFYADLANELYDDYDDDYDDYDDDNYANNNICDDHNYIRDKSKSTNNNYNNVNDNNKGAGRNEGVANNNEEDEYYEEFNDECVDEYGEEEEEWEEEYCEEYEEFVKEQGKVDNQRNKTNQKTQCTSGTIQNNKGKYNDTEKSKAHTHNVNQIVFTNNSMHSTLRVEDPDYDILDGILPELHKQWKILAPRELPLTESDAINALRESNYDINSCIGALISRRSTKRSTHSGLSISTSKSHTSAAKDNNSSNNVTSLQTSDLGATNANMQNAKKHTSTLGASETHQIAEKKNIKKRQEPTQSDAQCTASEVIDSSITSTTAAATITAAAVNLPVNKQKSKKNEPQPDREHPDCTIVIAGHVDAGKSTTLGHLLLLLDKVSVSEVNRNERDGKQYNKESFKYAWLLDQSEEERRRGVTIDAGSFSFTTAHRSINVLDAPGHKDYVLNMISSATQADAALLVVTAATGEFESGIQHGTKEHLLVLKTLGVNGIVVAVNKMDTVSFAQSRYDYVVSELKHLLKQLRIKEEVVVGYCPVSGMSGSNLISHDADSMPWYTGPTLVDLLDTCPLESRLLDGPLRMSLQDIQGNTLFGKVESGKLVQREVIQFVPQKVKVNVKRIRKTATNELISVAFAGDTVEVQTESSLIELNPGAIGCTSNSVLPTCTDFEAHIQTFTTLEKSILPGATFTMVIHSLTINVKVVLLVSKMDSKSGGWSKGMVKTIPPNTQALVIFRSDMPIAVEIAENCRALGRFVLQQDGEVVAGGLVKKIMTTT